MDRGKLIDEKERANQARMKEIKDAQIRGIIGACIASLGVAAAAIPAGEGIILSLIGGETDPLKLGRDALVGGLLGRGGSSAANAGAKGARNAAPRKTWEDFLPEAKSRVADSKAKHPGMDDVKGMARKRDIKDIDRIVKIVGLSKGQSDMLHRAITKKGFSLEEILEIAREIKKLFPNK